MIEKLSNTNTQGIQTISDSKVRFWETVGLYPWRTRLRQALIALLGDEDVPRTTFDLSSLGNLYPRIGLRLWQGKPVIPRKVIVSCLFNHTQTPFAEGWSVKRTQIQDFRGQGLTYNSHNGTDLAIPIGTTVVAAAPGEVVAIKSEFNRGGLKIFIDHGAGLMTTSVHLARALVTLGERVQRGQPIAISGYSGLDGLVTFPLGMPHVHFNTWLNGIPVDSFAGAEQVSLWRVDNAPVPFQPGQTSEPYTPSEYNTPKLAQLIESCITPQVKARLLAIPELKYRAAETIIEMNYYPTRFPEKMHVYQEHHPRQPVLDLPFLASDFDGVVFLDEIL